MKQRITGFHLDEEGHWVAELACGHNQHVRHTPPWVNRPWVKTAAGRAKKVGVELGCRLCSNPAGTPVLENNAGQGAAGK